MFLKKFYILLGLNALKIPKTQPNKKSQILLDTSYLFKKERKKSRKRWMAMTMTQSYLNLYHHARLHIETVLEFFLNFCILSFSSSFLWDLFLHFKVQIGKKRQIKKIALMRDTSDNKKLSIFTFVAPLIGI